MVLVVAFLTAKLTDIVVVAAVVALVAAGVMDLKVVL